ncbi:MAG: hypothetical protein WAU36_17995 [Cyclobacteriaceae bacterium]
MAKVHDTIVSYVAGKIQRLGFVIKYMEGDHTDVTIQKPDLPPKLTSHRPDVYALGPNNSIAIGEAKTRADLKSKRTTKQFHDFAKIVRQNPESILVIGIPQEAVKDLCNTLDRIGIVIDTQINIMTIPEQLLPSYE